MSVTPVGGTAPVFIDFAGGSSISQSVTVPAGCSRISVFVGLCPAGTIASRTVSAMTFNAASFTQAAGSRVTSTDGTFTSAEWQELTSPATGAHTFAATLTGTCRGGVYICFDIGDTGLGATGGAQDCVVALSLAAASSSLVRFGCVFQPTGTPSLVPTAAGVYQLGFNKSASAATRAVLTSYMRGYPDHPSCLTDGSGGGGVACSAIEITGAADVIF